MACGRSGKVEVTILASEWGSSKGGLSTINRNLAVQLAKSSDVEISFFVPQCSEKDKIEARRHKIKIVEAEKLVGYEELDWLSHPPDHLQIEVVVGHGVKLGRQAQIIRRYRQCKWVQVVHTDPEEMGMFKCYPDPISKGEEKHKNEVKLCEMADFVVGIGPKLAEAFRSYLRPLRNDQTVFDFTPGIFEEFRSVQEVSEEREYRKLVLVFGRGDAEDFKLKGFDIAAKAIIASLANTHLVFVGAPVGKHEEIAESFMQCGLPANRLRVRGYEESRESLEQLFCEVDLMLMPSRTEGFGLTGLEALSAGLPVLVSKNSGFGEALWKVKHGSSYVIDSENPEEWARAIDNVLWRKDRKTRLEEAKGIRESYQDKYSWTKQSEALLVNIISLVRARLPLRIDLDVARGPRKRDAWMRDTQEPQEIHQDGKAPSPSTSEHKQRRVDASGLAAEYEGKQNSPFAKYETQDVLNYIAVSCFGEIDPSNPEDRNGFVDYLQKVREVLIVGTEKGSLIITVEASSQQILQDLWKDYCRGHLNYMAQKYLVTDELLKRFDLVEVKIETVIREEDYKACLNLFTESPGWAMALSRPEGSRGNSLTKKLRDFSVKYVKISEDDMARSRELVRSYIESQVMNYCRENSLPPRGLPILRLEYTGSVYEGLKTEAADEVDVMVVLKTTRQEVTVEHTGIPGYVGLKASGSSNFRRYADPEGYIIPKRLRDAWFYSLVVQAVDAFNKKPQFSDVYLVARYHGPAVQIDILTKVTNQHLLSTDLVPCFQLESGDYYVAKSYSGDRQSSQADLLWRQSFSLKEKAKLQHMDRDGGCRHELLRIVKTLVKRQPTSLGTLESYHLKTAFMHYMDAKSTNWNGPDSLGEHFRGFLQKMQGYLERGFLPHYWLESVNLLEDINKGVVRQMADRMKRILNSEVEMNKVLA